jgi:hypothetical protein
VLADSPDMELADLVPSLKRAVAPPGQFAALFPESTDNDLADLLADAVAEAQLDGFLATNSLALDTAEVTPDLKNRTRYKAGAAEAETEQSASVLVELLRQTNTRKKQILDDAKYGRAGMSFAMVDLYVSKSIDLNSQDVGYITPGWR